MSRKDFELIAGTIAALDMNEDDRWHVANKFANELVGMNPRFDRDRFIQACVRD